MFTLTDYHEINIINNKFLVLTSNFFLKKNIVRS